ncbi:MAG: DUF2855 family protein [Erythrobacter sp.]
MNIVEVQVQRDALEEARLVEFEPNPLAEGGVRIAVESFAVTANNVTYAVMGEGFRYWDFFPPHSDEANNMGVVPMWGHARVLESNHSEIAAGERIYGYLPMASHLDVMPGKVHAGGFFDTAAHRQPMSPVYNQYTRLLSDPEHEEAREAERMIYGPLFRTGFLIEHFMRGENWFGAEDLLVTSASSKTAMSLASVTRERSPDIRRIGVTSTDNCNFVEDSGLYDKVLAYKEVGAMPLHTAVLVDFAGDPEVVDKIHAHLADMLKYSCLVGATHRNARSAQGEVRQPHGPKPTLFFAPDHAVAFFKEHGAQDGGAAIAESWRTFLEMIEDTVVIERKHGLEAARETFVAMVGGELDPALGIVIEP